MKAEIRRYKDSDGKPAVEIAFSAKTKKDLREVFKTEEMVRNLGIDFDTAYSVADHKRYWQLDWSLKAKP